MKMNHRRAFVICLPFCCLLLCASLADAQWTAPTQEELKMTAQPEVPGAAAVYLFKEEITNDQLHDWSKYVRLKVLTERGKGLCKRRAQAVRHRRPRRLHRGRY